MKIIFVTLFLLLPLQQVKTYYVILVKGSVKLERTNKELKTGDTFLVTDRLVFNRQDAKVVCAEKNSGRLILSPSLKRKGGYADNSLLVEVKDRLMPSTSNYRLSTRGTEAFEGYDPTLYFQSRETKDSILLIYDIKIPIKDTYKIDGDNFFFVQYEVNGERVLERINQGKGWIAFDERIFPCDVGTSLPGSTILGYQYVENGQAKSKRIATFIPTTLSEEEAIKQINMIRNHTSYADKEEMRKHILNHLYSEYGKIGEKLIDPLINSL